MYRVEDIVFWLTGLLDQSFRNSVANQRVYIVPYLKRISYVLIGLSSIFLAYLSYNGLQFQSASIGVAPTARIDSEAG